MDISILDFECQKALHLALRLARASGHSEVEIEHVALVMLTSSSLRLDQGSIQIYKHALEEHLSHLFKHFGISKLTFGKRLLTVLDECIKTKTDKDKIPADPFFAILSKHSTLLRNAATRLDVGGSIFAEGETQNKSATKSIKNADTNATSAEKGFKPGRIYFYTLEIFRNSLRKAK